MTGAQTLDEVSLRQGNRVVPSWLMRLLQFLGSVLLCFNPVTSLIVLGWTVRLMENRILSIAGQGAGDRQPVGLIFHNTKLLGLAEGLFNNIKAGSAAALLLLTLSLPYGAVWLFAWYAGWNNSFNKGYEQAAVGPLTGILGVFLFLAIAPILHLGMARYSYTRDWRSIFRLRQNYGLALSSWKTSAGLALMVLLAAVPLFLHKIFPLALGANMPGLDQLPPVEMDRLKFWYRFAGTAYLVAVFVPLKCWTAKLYGETLLAAFRKGEIRANGLFQREQALLDMAGVNHGDGGGDYNRSHAARLRRILRFCSTAVLWFGVVTLIFAGQFFNHAWTGWWLHPLVTLPWLDWPVA